MKQTAYHLVSPFPVPEHSITWTLNILILLLALLLIPTSGMNDE